MPDTDYKFMQRAIDLAQNGKATASPNPLVGCVVTKNDVIIGEGWHKKAGMGHAEVNAINSIDKQHVIDGSTAYVTLEPCAHHGRTPPCADLLIEKGFKRVVIGCTDPNPQVAGKGIEKLKKAGIIVEIGCLEKACLDLNKIFFHAIKHHKPYVILKWAQTADEFIARTNYDSKWISNRQSRQIVHKWRSETDAILVGKNTAKYDNPELTTRLWSGKHPLRILIDHKCSLPQSLHLFDGAVQTLVFNILKNAEEDGYEYKMLRAHTFLADLLGELYQEEVRSVLIEGGAHTLQQFIDAGLWNEARIFTANEGFEQGIEAPKLKHQVLVDHQMIGTDRLQIFKNTNYG